MSHTPTTAAAIKYESFEGFDPADHDYMLWLISMNFNGPSPGGLLAVRFLRNATPTDKQTAVRLLVNDHLAVYEPGVVLNNANIQISGQPV